MRNTLLAGVAMIAFGAGPAMAGGNIFLTGHDDDFHQSANAKAQVAAALTFVRNGSSLPVLTFDAGSELTSLLTSLGVTFTNVNPAVGANVTASLFNHSVYSAFVVASATSCGGCDNTPAAIANITAQSAAIASFFNAGGGIIGLAGAGDPNAYAYVPQSATNAGGSPPSSGFVQTADGATLGIPAVNGDTTHNFFNEPGTGGLSSAYKVVERLNNALTGTPESIALQNGTITCTVGCTITTTTPEPASLGMLAVGVGALVAARRRRRQQG
jgi:hypothetical protein